MNHIKCVIAILTFCFSICSVHSKEAAYCYKLAAVLMFQNEADHLKEWIEYHKLVGFEHFYLFNNASTDHYMNVLQRYVDSGEVELFHYPQINDNQADHTVYQCRIYNHALELARGKVKWLAVIDGDEYIVPVGKKSISKILKNFEDVGGVYINWLVFGTSHVEKIPKDRLMIEMLNHCEAKPTGFGKSIVRPERVSNCTDPHRMWYRSPYYHVNTNHQKFDWVPPIADDKLLIHHYYTKDLDFLVNVKFPRVQKWIGVELESYIRSTDVFNAVYNPFMMRFVPTLKKQMGMQNAMQMKR